MKQVIDRPRRHTSEESTVRNSIFEPTKFKYKIIDNTKSEKIRPNYDSVQYNFQSVTKW